MATRVNKRALMTTTKVTAPPAIEGEIVQSQDVDILPNETPVMGDNSTTQRDAVEEKQNAHNHLAVVLRDWIATDVKVEYIRQQAAFDIMRRHATLATEDNVAPPRLASMAYPGPKNANGRYTTNNVYSSYLTALVNEFAGPYMSEKDCDTVEKMEARRYRNLVNTRLDRALRLACNLAWWKLDQNAFDMERIDPVTKEPIGSAWKVPPRAFIPPGYQCGTLMFELLADGVTLTPRAFAYLEADTKGKTYFANTERNAPDPITLSLDQFNAATAKHIDLELQGTTTDDGASPQKAGTTRTARQTGTTATPKVGEVAPSDTTSVAATAGQPGLGRDWYIAELNKALFACSKLLNHDDIGAVKRSDLSDGAWQGMEDIAMVHRRIKVNEMPGVDTGSVVAPKVA